MGEEPAVSSVSHRGFTHLGLDVSKDSISVAVLEPERDRAAVRSCCHPRVVLTAYQQMSGAQRGARPEGVLSAAGGERDGRKSR